MYSQVQELGFEYKQVQCSGHNEESACQRMASRSMGSTVYMQHKLWWTHMPSGSRKQYRNAGCCVRLSGQNITPYRLGTNDAINGGMTLVMDEPELI
jgi:hypothetical protein